MALTSADRRQLVDVLVYHQQINDPPHTSVCLCGWRQLGASWPEHVADVYEATLAIGDRGCSR